MQLLVENSISLTVKTFVMSQTQMILLYLPKCDLKTPGGICLFYSQYLYTARFESSYMYSISPLLPKRYHQRAKGVKVRTENVFSGQ